MSETYCGKSCDECAQRESLNCPGCKAGPGRQIDGGCEVAQCCMEKGHESCAICRFRVNCGPYISRYDQMDYRRKARESAERRQAEISSQAPALGKLFWGLFWVIIIGSAVNLITSFAAVFSTSPAPYWGSLIWSVLATAAYGLILLRLSHVKARYGTAGKLLFLSLAVSIPGKLLFLSFALGISGSFLSNEAYTSLWSLLFFVLAGIISLIGDYHEFTAHTDILSGAQDALSKDWFILRKWYIGSFGALLAGIILLQLPSLLGFIISLTASIGGLIVSIVKVAYLYKTAMVFRGYAAEAQGEAAE